MRLRDYQQTAVAHLSAHPRAGLFMKMGHGKTAVCLTALTPVHLPVLVVAPKRVAENVWHAEAAQWRPDLKVGRAVGTPAQRARVLSQADLDVVVVSQDNVADLAVAERDWQTVIIDELSGYKQRKSVRWRTVRKLTLACPHVWGLTGTPVPNGFTNLWSQLYLLDNGARLGKTQTVFRDKWFTPGRRLPNGVVIRWDLRPGAEEEIRETIRDICFSVSGRVELPPVIYNEVTVPLPPKVQRAYSTLHESLVLDLQTLGLGTLTHTADTAAALSNRLCQIAAGFLYEDREQAEQANRPQQVERLHTERVKAVREIVDGTGSPVIVVYRYLPELAMLREEFKDDLYTAKEPRLQERWNAGEFPVLACHPASIGHGLNLQQGGHTMVWMSLTWDQEQWEQLNARLPRFGQQNPVTVHLLMSPGTMDSRIYAALRAKTSVQDALMDYLESPV